ASSVGGGAACADAARRAAAAMRKRVRVMARSKDRASDDPLLPARNQAGARRVASPAGRRAPGAIDPSASVLADRRPMHAAPLLLLPRPRLAADEVEQVAHREVEIDR